MTIPSVFASIITIGDELLIGQTIDTNSAFIAQELNRIGIWVRRRVAVGDLKDDIRQALDEERKYSQVIIITGGLGPTADDITKPLLCEYFGGKLVLDQGVLDHVKYLFEKVYMRTGPILQRNLDQALVPDVCTVLPNALGSAPGMWFDIPRQQDGRMVNDPNRKVFVSLPGVPFEMKGLMTDQVIPRLLKTFTLPAIVHRTAFTAGQGESMIAESIRDYENSLPENIKLAYLPSYGMVKLRLTARGADKLELEKQITPYFDRLLTEVNDYLVSSEDEGLEVTVGKILLAAGKTVGTAESCTGGNIAHLLTSVPGSSAYFMGSIVSYSNSLKQDLLGVEKKVLDEFGAVSRETVEQMAKGALEKLKTDYVVVTSGIMGPDGGTPDKPVGTVWIAVGGPAGIKTLKLNIRQDRQRNISIASLNALNFLRKIILSAN
ncbi:MAG: CinA family nicotinamide mononucleotide deamidase-related protein [Chitinophagaceae bacterium]